MDEQLVLTALTLRLNPNLQRAQAVNGVCVLKNVPARKYLTVTVPQWNLLRNFSNPATVPDVLRAVIMNRTCVPLREYYELILKAQRAGILLAERQTETEVPAGRWLLPLTPWVPVIMTWACAILAVTFLAVYPFPRLSSMPMGVLQLVAGWLMLIAGVSLGNALAASVLRTGGGEVYDPKFLLWQPVPHFTINLDDACMTPRFVQAGVWSARLLPVTATAAFLFWKYPSWGVLHIVALLVMLRPFALGGAVRLLSAVCRGYTLDTHRKMIFSMNRRWHVRLKFGLKRVSALYLTARLLWGAAWSVLALFVMLHAVGALIPSTDVKLREVFGNADAWRRAGVIFFATAVTALVAYVLPPIVRSLYVLTQSYWYRIRRWWRRVRIKSPSDVPAGQASRTLAESLLFRKLSPAERSELLKIAQPRFFKSWKLFLRFQDKSNEAGIILSGKIAVYRRLKSGRAERILELNEGDVFGAHALLDETRQHVQLRTTTPVVALMMPLEEFQKRVIEKIGANVANDLMHKVSFLRKLDFCSSWHPQALGRFAQLASIVGFNSGQKIIAERQDSQQFYVVYEGRVTVKRGRRVQARLKPGSFFGEISLLQNGVAVAEVASRDESRCLVVTKTEFLRFLTHNPKVALDIEAVSSERLGRPIFPLKAGSFEVR